MPIVSQVNLIVSEYYPDLIIRAQGGVGGGQEGPNLKLEALAIDGVPSLQFLINNSEGELELVSSQYNDAFNTVFATWQDGHQQQFYTYSETNINTVSRKFFIGSGDTAEAAFTMNTFFRVFSDNGVTETFAVNGQTGEMYLKGDISLNNILSNIGDSVYHLNHIYSYYSSQNVLRPINGTLIAVQDINGVPRFEFKDLESTTNDFALTPTISYTGNLGTKDNVWKLGFIDNLEIQNSLSLIDNQNNKVVEIDENGFFFNGDKMVTMKEYNALENKLNNICSELLNQGINISSCK